ncbi:MAG: hypothetical protein KGJ93_01545 [Patescibacteria group bacterium]|nr:hypothetical protein [Patescibacteria group bacterium]
MNHVVSINGYEPLMVARPLLYTPYLVTDESGVERLLEYLIRPVQGQWPVKVVELVLGKDELPYSFYGCQFKVREHLYCLFEDAG